MLPADFPMTVDIKVAIRCNRRLLKQNYIVGYSWNTLAMILIYSFSGLQEIAWRGVIWIT
jgi:hypothetical protein